MKTNTSNYLDHAVYSSRAIVDSHTLLVRRSVTKYEEAQQQQDIIELKYALVTLIKQATEQLQSVERALGIEEVAQAVIQVEDTI